MYPKWLVRIFITIITCLLVPSLLLSQDYQRKSISFIPALHTARSGGYSLQQEEMDYLAATIREQIEMPRFYINDLPDAITTEFMERSSRISEVSLEELESVLNVTIVPIVRDILNTEMEIRARDLVTDEQQQQFIATKAQTYGITASQLETVMNSAYIYVPFVNTIRIDEDDDMVTAHIDGGLFWYHVEMIDTEPQVEPLLRQEAVSFGQAKEDNHYSYNGQFINGEKFALYTAMDNFARNLQYATRSLPEFALSGMVNYVQGSKLEFGLGRSEGIKVDDGFYVGEQRQDSDGQISTERVGFVRTVSVANNSEDEAAYSRAAAVIGGQFVKGMTLIEHPRLPIDLVVRPRIYRMNITEGKVGIYWPDGGDLFTAEFSNEYDKPTFGIDFEANYHLGRHMDIPMFLVGIGGTFSPVPQTIRLTAIDDQLTWKTIPFAYQVHFGIAKKYFYRRVGLVLSAKFGTSVLKASQSVSFDGKHSIGLTNRTAGGIFQVGLEYVASPDFYIGGYAGYQAFPRSPVWTFDVDDKSIPLYTNSAERPEYSALGYTFGIYLHYQPPALPFDPFSFLRGVAGL